MDKTARTRFLEMQAEAGLGSRHTAHRQMVALRWLQDNAARYGVALDQVVSPYTTVEALAMLKAERPDQVAKIARDALRGRITSREVIRLAAIARDRRHGPNWPSTWAVFLQEEIGSMVPRGKAEILDQVDWMSEPARILQVDVEWVQIKEDGEHGDRYAIFLSPRLKHALGSTFSEVFKAIMLARGVFARVCFVTYDRDERDFVEKHQHLFKTDKSAALVISDVERVQAALVL